MGDSAAASRRSRRRVLVERLLVPTRTDPSPSAKPSPSIGSSRVSRPSPTIPRRRRRPAEPWSSPSAWRWSRRTPGRGRTSPTPCSPGGGHGTPSRRTPGAARSTSRCSRRNRDDPRLLRAVVALIHKYVASLHYEKGDYRSALDFAQGSRDRRAAARGGPGQPDRADGPGDRPLAVEQWPTNLGDFASAVAAPRAEHRHARDDPLPEPRRRSSPRSAGVRAERRGANGATKRAISSPRAATTCAPSASTRTCSRAA